MSPRGPGRHGAGAGIREHGNSAVLRGHAWRSPRLWRRRRDAHRVGDLQWSLTHHRPRRRQSMGPARLHTTLHLPRMRHQSGWPDHPPDGNIKDLLLRKGRTRRNVLSLFQETAWRTAALRRSPLVWVANGPDAIGIGSGYTSQDVSPGDGGLSDACKHVLWDALQRLMEGSKRLKREEAARALGS
jgi:hypothetical protein